MTNDGLEDVIEIARQDRPSLYDQWADRPPPLVPRAWRARRGRAAGRRRDRAASRSAPECLAVPSGADGRGGVPAARRPRRRPTSGRWRRALRARGLDVTCSHEVSPEFREYERTVTTVVNAYLRPVCRAYLRAAWPALAPSVRVMTSAGGLVDLAVGRRAAGRACCCPGPAAGVRAAAAVAAANGFAGAISFDMGGTSTDVCLIEGGVPEPAPSLVVGGYPVRLPALDIHTIGAGGGSIAGIDAGGALAGRARARPGRCPGPACYGRGRQRADGDRRRPRARAHPGRARRFPGIGRARRRRRRGRRSTRAGVRRRRRGRRWSTPPWPQALRVVSVERGVDPAGLALVAFGGAGPLHACALADALGMAGGDRAGPGRRVLGRRAAGRARASATWCGRGRRPLDHDGLRRRPGRARRPTAAAELLAAPHR